MNILHINDYEKRSGAENIYVTILNKLGGDTIVLEKLVNNKSQIIQYLGKFFFSFNVYKEIRKKLKKKVDVILIHNINLSPFSVLLAIKGHKNIVQIVHDATQAGCPSAWTKYRKNYGICDVKMKLGKCMKNCAFDKPKVAFSIYYIRLKVFLFLKKKIIRKYISPSIALKSILINNGFMPTINLGNTIEIENSQEDFKKENILLYVGAIDARKGIDKLINAIDNINQIKEKRYFYIIGDGELKEDLELQYKDSFYNFLGKVSNEKVLEICKLSKILFVPSILFDNYPTVAIEGIMNNNIVLGTDSGGIKEIIGKENIFDILDQQDIKNKTINIIENYETHYNLMLLQKEKLIDHNRKYYEKLKKELIS